MKGNRKMKQTPNYTMNGIISEVLGLDYYIVTKIETFSRIFGVSISEKEVTDIITKIINDGASLKTARKHLVNLLFEKIIAKTFMQFPFVEDLISVHKDIVNEHLYFDGERIYNREILERVLKPYAEKYEREQEMAEKEQEMLEKENCGGKDETFVYPDVLKDTDEMYTEAKRISFDDAIFNSRKALLEKHFAEYPIYIDGSYYVQSTEFPRVVRTENGTLSASANGNDLATWRECHYYALMDYNGHRFFIMSGGRYD